MDSAENHDKLSVGINDAQSPTLPNLVVVYDEHQDCPYLDGQIARMPIEVPLSPLSGHDLDRLLNEGYRRTGPMFYRTQCPQCSECIPTRICVQDFSIRKSMRRILNRAERELTISLNHPIVDQTRLDLFNAHREARQLSKRGPADLSDYHEFLVATCVSTVEIGFSLNDKLVGIAIVDVGHDSLNAVYTHFSAAANRYSIGTLAILKLVQWAQQSNRSFVYLGLYVQENSHLNYKGRFRPQQRRIAGCWECFD